VGSLCHTSAAALRAVRVSAHGAGDACVRLQALACPLLARVVSFVCAVAALGALRRRLPLPSARMPATLYAETPRLLACCWCGFLISCGTLAERGSDCHLGGVLGGMAAGALLELVRAHTSSFRRALSCLPFAFLAAAGFSRGRRQAVARMAWQELRDRHFSFWTLLRCIKLLFCRSSSATLFQRLGCLRHRRAFAKALAFVLVAMLGPLWRAFASVGDVATGTV